MENISGVTKHLRKKVIERRGDPDLECLNLIPTKDGRTFFVDSIGSYWRSYLFIVNATCYDQVEKPDHFYQSGLAFGNFQSLLSDYDADSYMRLFLTFITHQKGLKHLKVQSKRIS